MGRHLRAVSRFVVPLCLLALAACGFHLRGTGSQALSVTPITLTASAFQEADRALRDALSRINALAERDAESTGRLWVQREQLRRRPLATAGQGSATQYELRLELTYQFEQNDVGTGATTASVFAERNYEFDLNNLSANSQEEDLLTREMRRELAQQVVRQLSATLNRGSSTL